MEFYHICLMTLLWIDPISEESNLSEIFIGMHTREGNFNHTILHNYDNILFIVIN